METSSNVTDKLIHMYIQCSTSFGSSLHLYKKKYRQSSGKMVK